MTLIASITLHINAPLMRPAILLRAVIRQGEMQYIDGPVAKWASGHFVLTRAGFLHWFRAMDQVEPIGTLGLARLDMSIMVKL